MIEVVCGLPGSGKTYYAVRRAVRAARRGRPVFANFPIFLDGVYRLNKEWLSSGYNFPRGALLIIDEAGAWFSSRDWSRFDTSVFAFFSQHRKGELDLIIVTQHPRRIDVSLRELANYYILIEPWCFGFGFRATEYTEISGDNLMTGGRGAQREMRRFFSRRIFHLYDSWHRDSTGDTDTVPLLPWINPSDRT